MEITLNPPQAASLLKAIDEYYVRLHQDAQQTKNQEQRQLCADIEQDLRPVRDQLCDELLYEIRSAMYHPVAH